MAEAGRINRLVGQFREIGPRRVVAALFAGSLAVAAAMTLRPESGQSPERVVAVPNEFVAPGEPYQINAPPTGGLDVTLPPAPPDMAAAGEPGRAGTTATERPRPAGSVRTTVVPPPVMSTTAQRPPAPPPAPAPVEPAPPPPPPETPEAPQAPPAPPQNPPGGPFDQPPAPIADPAPEPGAGAVVPPPAQ